MISPEDHTRLSQAIRDAEDLTTGEIMVVVAEQASSYRSIPVLWALLTALVVPWPLIAITTLGPARIFLIQLLVGVFLSVFLSWPSRRHRLVPGFIKRARAREAAAREFLSRGLTRTRERTGVLIYVALAERYAEILVDTGIADRVEKSVWHDIIADLTGQIREGRLTDGLVTAIRRSGAILAEHAPPRFDDVDELPNKVILI
ncbi:TPM domain-containing protein [Microvirga rosea]|uniref:TPM domain-containing protein n=1 Tax=Microvirga rosea TaxID=2715425 RepID=UPI001D0B3DB9|nr:TPM domain-containing protein [Microvirga rosea]MCB8819091.1 TPM domain-containing protein [Microvirga rosea]